MAARTRFTKPQQESEVKEKMLPVLCIRDHIVPYPELYMEVYIPEPGEERAFAPLFARSSCYKADSPDDADLVVFTGGPDVGPQLYGEEPHVMTRVDKARDNRDMELYAYCLMNNIPMLGICRGAQFLHVMNGGKLFQHVDGHTGDHSIFDKDEDRVIPRISSTHHQMVMPNDNMHIIATSVGQSQMRWPSRRVRETGNNEDIEAFFYRGTGCLGIQGHPEYGDYGVFSVWAAKKIENYIAHNQNTVLTSGKYRVKADVEIKDEGKSESKGK